MKVRELAPGIYERVDTPRDVKITMDDAKRLAALTNSQALADMLVEVVRSQEEASAQEQQKSR